MLSRYTKLIFNKLHTIQEKPKARLVREKKTGNPINPSQTQIILDIVLPVLYGETQIVLNESNALIPKTQMFFYIKKEDLPNNTRPLINDKIIYKDKTYIVTDISEIVNIYKLNVEYM